MIGCRRGGHFQQVGYWLWCLWGQECDLWVRHLGEGVPLGGGSGSEFGDRPGLYLCPPPSGGVPAFFFFRAQASCPLPTLDGWGSPSGSGDPGV